MTTDVHQDRSRNFGVALSGGGARAAAFALGALLYLVDSGLNRRTRVISSVSGASITNGFVLTQLDDFGTTDRESFDSVAKEMIQRLLTAPLMGRAILALNALALLVGALAAMLSALAWPIDLGMWLRIALPFAWAAAFMFRGAPIEYLLNKKYFGGHQSKLGRQRSAGATTHIFCSTDLVTSSPFFFVDYCSTGCTYIRPYGWALANNLSVATAVRASTAMPGAFPPRALRSAQLEFVDEVFGTSPRPPWFQLADGGVWDNLGTQWFSERTGAPSSDWKNVAARLDGAPQEGPPGCDGIENLLVIDARGWGPGFSFGQWSLRLRSGLFRIPLLSEFLTLSKASSLQYLNTVEPRIDGCMESLRLRMRRGAPSGGVAVSVGTLTDYPFYRAGPEAWNVIPQRVRDELDEDPGLWMNQESVRKLPNHLRALVDYAAKTDSLQAQSLDKRVPDWLGRHYADVEMTISTLWIKCSDIGTKLSALSKAEAIALLVHGYIQAMGAASALIVVERGKPGPLPLMFPGFDRFEMLFGKPPA
jgi:hypothetical protein